MDEMLASMWNSFSLAESEAIILNIEDSNLSRPKFTLVGKLAMKKHVNTAEVDRNLKNQWNTLCSMETNLVGENVYLFSFNDEATCDRVLSTQPWNVHGSVMLLDRTHNSVSPVDMKMTLVPFWVQIHGLSVRAMNKTIGESLGALLGTVLDIFCDAEGNAIGKCTRV